MHASSASCRCRGVVPCGGAATCGMCMPDALPGAYACDGARMHPGTHTLCHRLHADWAAFSSAPTRSFCVRSCAQLTAAACMYTPAHRARSPVQVCVQRAAYEYTLCISSLQHAVHASIHVMGRSQSMQSDYAHILYRNECVRACTLRHDMTGCSKACRKAAAMGQVSRALSKQQQMQGPADRVHA